jgi:DNA-binding transcriptional LysR family regulator
MSKSNVERKNLSWSRLVNFAAVVRKGGISAATGGDPSGVALISRQIAELESHFEVELTRRQGNGIVITAAGDQLARLINDFERGLDDLRARVQNAPVAYSLAASNSVLYWLVLPKLKTISDTLPSVKWMLYHESTAAICQKVVMGEIDFGLCVGSPSGANLKRRYMGEVEYLLFVPASFGEKADAATVLSNCPLALPIGGTLRASLDSWAKKARINLNIRLEVDSYMQAADVVNRGTHAAVLPSLAAATMPKGVRSVPLPATVALRRKLWLVWTNRLLRTRSVATGVRDELVRALAR